MRLSCSLGSLLTVDEILRCSRALAGTRTDTIWIPETWGMECFAMLAAACREAPGIRVGSSVINTYSRSPAAVAMGAATVDALSGGRMALGLGTSSPPIVESLHGAGFERPLLRMREYVEIVRLAHSGASVDYDGRVFRLRGFRLMVRPRGRVPIYVAAVNRRMVDLAWEIGDGVIFYLRPLREMRETISRMRGRGGIDVACQIITSVSEDAQAAIDRAKRTLAFYVSVGRIYREFLAANGFAREAGAIYDEYSRAGHGGCAGLVPDSMLRQLCIAGSPAECEEQLRAFAGAGLDLPILQFNPAGDAEASFGAFRSAFGPLAGGP